MRHFASKPISVTLDRPRRLRYTIGAIVDVEEILGHSITELKSWSDLPIIAIRSLLRAGLLADDALITDRQVGSFFSLLEMGLVTQSLSLAFIEAYGAPTKAEEKKFVVPEPEAKPKRKKKQKQVDWRSFIPIAIVSMKLSFQDFWEMTPKEFLLLYDRYIWELENEDYGYSLICSVLANVNSGKNGKKFKAKDFMPDRRPKDTKKQNWKEQLEIAKQITLAFGGHVKKELRAGADNVS